MQEIKENIRQQLYGFYIAYDLWLSNGANSGGVFSQNYGLCANLFDYLTLIGAPCEEALEQLHADFRSAGLNEALPFNESKEHYHEERECNMCHMNPARVVWVRAQIVQAAESLVPDKLPREYIRGWPLAYSDYAEGWNDCREAMLQSQGEGNPHVTLARLPGGFTIEDAKELHEDLVRCHISQALSGEKMKNNDRDADLCWIHGVIVQAAWFVKASLDALPEPLREEKGGSANCTASHGITDNPPVPGKQTDELTMLVKQLVS